MALIAAVGALTAVGAAGIAGAIRESGNWRNEVGGWRLLTSQVNNVWDKRVETECRDTRAQVEQKSAAWRDKAERELIVSEMCCTAIAISHSLIRACAGCITSA